jgi:two-component system, response regulator YesN
VAKNAPFLPADQAAGRPDRPALSIDPSGAELMAHLVLRPIKLFRFKSVFTTILISMISLSIVLAFIFSVYFTNTILNNTAKHRIELDKAFLNTDVGNTDYIISNLHQSLTQLSFSYNIFRLGFVNVFNEDDANYAMTDMAQAATNSSLIESTFLFLPRISTVITSSYKTYSVNDSPDLKLINLYETGAVNAVVISDIQARKSALFYYDGKLLMARDFPLFGKRRLATIFYVINTRELYRHMTSGLPSSAGMWVFDAKDTPLFAKLINYPQDITPGEISTLAKSPNATLQNGNSAMLFNASQLTGWRFVYTVDESENRPTAGSLMMVFAPIIVGIVIMASIVAFLIASRLYRPFRRLLMAIESKNISPEALQSSKNEFDYLNYAFTEIAMHQSEMQTMLNNVSRDVLSRLFQELLSGTQISYANVKEILASTKSPFQAHDPYVSCAFRCISDPPMSESQLLVILSELLDMMKAFNSKHQSLSHVLVMNANTYAIIMSFSEQSQIVQIKKQLTELESSLRGLARRQGVSASFCSGHVYHSILDVGFSYKEALAGVASDSELKGPSEIESVHLTVKDLNTRAQQLVELVFKNDVNGAHILLERIINELLLSAPRIEELAASFETLTDALVNNIVKLNYIDLSSISDDLFMFKADQHNYTNSADLSAFVKHTCLTIIDELARILKKQQNHFIVAAQEYIGRNISNYDLSLNLVANGVGANPSYLSTLFNENMGVHFTDYLNHERIEFSLRSLEETDKSIKEIAFESGFNSVQNYIRVFKKYKGTAPGQYKANLGKGEAGEGSHSLLKK